MALWVHGMRLEFKRFLQFIPAQKFNKETYMF